MKTYIISLKDSEDRRKHVLRQLASYKNLLEIDVIDAYDGRNMSDQEMNRIIDQNAAIGIYGRKIIGPEIGCTLSHRRCLNAMLQNNDKAAIIFEDDLVLPSDKDPEFVEYFEFVKSHPDPILLLLSGDYWYTTIRRINSRIKYAKVREAVCSHAYICNSKAAQLITSNPSHFLADDWYSIKKMGVRVLAAFPHIADQNRRDLKTEISEDYTGFIRRNLSLMKQIQSYYRAIVKRMLLYIGHFEAKSFI